MDETYKQLLADTRAKFKELDEREKSLVAIVSEYRKELTQGTGTSKKYMESSIKKKSELADFEQELTAVSSQRQELLKTGSKLLGNELVAIKRDHINNFKEDTFGEVSAEIKAALEVIFKLIVKTDAELEQELSSFENEVYEGFSTFLSDNDMERVLSRYLTTFKGSARDILTEKLVTARLGEVSNQDLNGYLEEKGNE